MDTVATGLSFTSYTDTSAPAGETCSYVVSASNTYGEGGDSMEVTVTLPASTDAAPPAAGGAGETGTAPAPAPSPAAEAAPPTGEGNGSPEPEPARPAAPSEESEPETMH